MTEAFEKWYNKMAEGKFPGSYENAHSWLRAFAQEVEQRTARNGGGEFALANAFWFIEQEFGLDKEDKK